MGSTLLIPIIQFDPILLLIVQVLEWLLQFPTGDKSIYNNWIEKWKVDIKRCYADKSMFLCVWQRSKSKKSTAVKDHNVIDLLVLQVPTEKKKKSIYISILLIC